jgi:hypothetical protein
MRHGEPKSNSKSVGDSRRAGRGDAQRRSSIFWRPGHALTWADISSVAAIARHSPKPTARSGTDLARQRPFTLGAGRADLLPGGADDGFERMNTPPSRFSRR